jgi:hypothetical protein
MEVLTMKRFRWRWRWRLRSLLWLVLIAGAVLGLIRYGQDQAARTKPVVRRLLITINDGDGLVPRRAIFI